LANYKKGRQVDSVKFLRSQALYRPGQEGQEREWCRQMNAAADEIEKLRIELYMRTRSLEEEMKQKHQ
jgi:hypothetical protein